MELITLALAGLTGAASMLSAALALRMYRKNNKHWGHNPWGTNDVIDDSIHFGNPQTPLTTPSRGQWFVAKKQKRARSIITDALPSEKVVPQVYVIGQVPPPDQF
jgi:hypothetical protein